MLSVCNDDSNLFAVAVSAIAKNAAIAPKAATTPLRTALLQRNHWSELRGQVITQGNQDRFITYLRTQPRCITSPAIDKKSTEFSQSPRFIRRKPASPSRLRSVETVPRTVLEKCDPLVSECGMVLEFVCSSSSVEVFNLPASAVVSTPCEPAVASSISAMARISVSPKPAVVSHVSLHESTNVVRAKKTSQSAQQKRAQKMVFRSFRNAVLTVSQMEGKVVVNVTARPAPIKRKSHECSKSVSMCCAKRPSLQPSSFPVFGVVAS